MSSISKFMAICMCLLWPISVFADGLYYGSEKFSFTEGSNDYTLKLLFGDGILTSDPVRAIVVDDDGKLAAVSHASQTLTLHCGEVVHVRSCSIYEGRDGVILEADPVKFQTSVVVEADGQPLIHPWDMKMSEFGFTARAASLSEIIKFEALIILRSPVEFLLSVLWWLGVWLLGVILFWRLKRNTWKITPVSIQTAVPTIALFLGFLAMWEVTRIFWFWSKGLLYYWMIASGIGLIIAILTTRPKKTT